MGKKAWFSACIIVVWFVVASELIHVSPAVESGAELTKITHSERLRSAHADTWTVSVRNVLRSENDSGEARFHLEFYADGDLLFDEYKSTDYRTWSCRTGDTMSNTYRIKGWSQIRPSIRGIQVRLYWHTNGTVYLEDTESFGIAVTVYLPLQHIQAVSYLAAFIFACFLLLAYDYVASLME